jgi:hypothetical protein
MTTHTVTGIGIKDRSLVVSYTGHYQLTLIPLLDSAAPEKMLMLLLTKHGYRVAICDFTSGFGQLVEPANPSYSLPDVGEFWQTALNYLMSRLTAGRLTPEHETFLRYAWHIVSLDSATALPELLRTPAAALPQRSSIGSYRGD